MKPLTRDDLMSLEQYAAERAEFRARVMAHKKNRGVMIGDHCRETGRVGRGTRPTRPGLDKAY